MKKVINIYLASAVLFSLNLYSQTEPVISIIPKPAKIEVTQGQFKFTPQTKFVISEQSEELHKLSGLIISRINQSTGWKIKTTSETVSKNFVLIQLKKDFLPSEGYSLDIKPNKISISAGSGAGIFYAIQSLFQLMPVDANKNNLSVPCLLIEDSPLFKWRGMHLDVCRHFFPVEFIKKYIDVLAMYKMNTFHWHLTEDQGWRIEIKKYPKLTEIGAWRKDDNGNEKPYGGFYTQEQIRDIVEYAKQKYITIIPEIEMPGHALAALASYPELSCTGGPFKVETLWGVFEDVYCAGNDKVFDFLEDVLTEVIDLFPSEIIHIGGDEVPKTRWHSCPKCQARIKAEGLKDEAELQSYFIQRIEKFLNSKGRKIIGWDEILEGGLAPNAAVMSWRGIDGGIAAAKAKHYAAMSPGTHCYFDHSQGLSGEPKTIGGFTPLEKVYSYEPVPDALNAEEAKYIMGAQANIWTEYIETTNYVEYMLLPRMLALSEVVWSPKELRNYDDFSKRIEKHYDLLAKLNYNFRIPAPIIESGESLITKNKSVELKSPVKNSKVYYTLDGTEPTIKSKLYTKPLIFSKNSFLKTRTILKNGKSSYTTTCIISKVDPSVNGLNYKYYEGKWNIIPDFNALKLSGGGTIGKLALSEMKTPEEYFSAVIDGFILIDKPGDYIFYLSSDDGSKLLIDKSMLIDNDGLHSTKEKRGKISLTAGRHSIQIQFLQGSGGKDLKVEYEGPSLVRQPVSASKLFFN
jgi:hexosaminidase